MGEWVADDTGGGLPCAVKRSCTCLTPMSCAAPLRRTRSLVPSRKPSEQKPWAAATNRKLTLPAGPEANFAGKGGVLLDEGYAAVKWYGYIGNNARRGLPDFSPLLILSSTETGLPLAVLDGRWIPAVRTASITAVEIGRATC